jgi:hypothetical protein
MDFSEIKAGDTIRVTTPARVQNGFGGKVRNVPESTVTVRVDSINGVNGQPGRQQARCTIVVTADGEVLPEPGAMFPGLGGELAKQKRPDLRPSFDLYSDLPIGQIIERA